MKKKKRFGFLNRKAAVPIGAFLAALSVFLPVTAFSALSSPLAVNKAADTVMFHGDMFSQNIVPPPPPGIKPPPIPLPLPASPPPSWIKNDFAVLQVLDKASLRLFTLKIPVGDSATIGTLTLNVQACYASGPTKPSDAAVFLLAEDAKTQPKGSLIFRGWILRAVPGASPFADPYYDLRLIRCGITPSLPVYGAP